MKKITSLLLLLCSFAVLSQVSDRANEYISASEVPELVKKSHEANFPNTFIKEWYVDRGLSAVDKKPVRYRTEFSDTGNSNTRFATYLPNGDLFYHTKFYQPNNIPSSIVLKTRSEFNNYEMEYAEFITMYNPKREIYRVKLRDQSLVQMVYYSIDGIRIPESQLPEEMLVFKL